MRTTRSVGFGCSFLLLLLSAISGVAVTLFLTISLSPMVKLFPPTSGAREVAYGIAIMWGVVVAATVAVYAFGSVRRHRQTADFYDASWQERYVPGAAPRYVEAAPALPVYRQAAPATSRGELDFRLQQMEEMLDANRRLVERLERAQAPQPVPAARQATPAPVPYRPVAPQPYPTPPALRGTAAASRLGLTAGAPNPAVRLKGHADPNMLDVAVVRRRSAG